MTVFVNSFELWVECAIKAVWSDFFTGPVWKYGIYV